MVLTFAIIRILTIIRVFFCMIAFYHWFMLIFKTKSDWMLGLKCWFFHYQAVKSLKIILWVWFLHSSKILDYLIEWTEVGSDWDIGIPRTLHFDTYNGQFFSYSFSANYSWLRSWLPIPGINDTFCKHKKDFILWTALKGRCFFSSENIFK